MIPFLEKLEKPKRILIAGCGGGFDAFAGVPIGERLLAAGKELVFANCSFTNLWLCGGERLTPVAWRIDKQSNEIPFFPEKWLAELAGTDRIEQARLVIECARERLETRPRRQLPL